MCESSFAVRCLTSGLNLSAFGVRSAAVVVVVVVVAVVVVVGPGHVNLFLSETMNGASSDAPPTDRVTSPHCQTLQLQRTIQHE